MEVIKKESNKGAVSKLMSGDYRLVDVFWAGYIICGAVLTSFVTKLSTVEAAIAGAILLSIYYLFLSVAVWRSANKYTGRKLWVVLAKVIVVLNLLQTIVSMGAIVYAFVS
ncbi:hypothetical protein [Vibrio sp. Isolate24]|uniref:hypothetical protein n=1 Tax=Vibrio sp. Isolate24 TaxID=2908534 RepID=UPI001EFCECA3|nr:hypothetical protein [Vibrio sp. Isolate24]MCG9679142.1 hypothetical protein [Vibrio sp. Isolate24]